MLPQLSKALAGRTACLRTTRLRFGRTSFVRSSSSLTPQAPSVQTSAIYRYKTALYIAAGCVAIGGAAVTWYKWRQREHLMPYSASISKACMQTLNHGGPGNVVYSAAQILAEMSRSSDPSVANALIEDGVLETCLLALQRHFNSSEEGQHIQGRAIFQILRLLSHLTAFPDISDRLVSYKHNDLILLLLKSGYEIENGVEDPWVQPLSQIFASLLNADLRSISQDSNGSYSHFSRILELPTACHMLSTQLLPYSDVTNAALADSIVLAISTFFPTETASKIFAFGFNREGSTKDARETWIGPNHEVALEDLIKLSIATARVIFSSPNSAITKASTSSMLLSNLAVMANILAQKEHELLNSLEFRVAELSALNSDTEESATSEHLLFSLNYSPWFSSMHFNENDAATRDLLAGREKLLTSYQSILDVLPTCLNDLETVKSAVSTLLAVTSTRDDVMMYRIGQKAVLMKELLSKWILLDPSTLSSPHYDTKPSSPSTMAQNENEWETCPITPTFQLPSTDPLTLANAAETASQVRHGALELLARLSNVPSIASQISISRCMCSVQLDERFPAFVSPVNVSIEQLDVDVGENVIDEMGSAINTIERLRPIQNIIFNVSRNAPDRVRPSDIERIVSMNPSELESLALLSSISSTPEVASKILSNPICTHFVFNLLMASSSNVLPDKPNLNGSSVKNVSDDRQSKDEPDHSAPDMLKLRLALQTVANLAKADPLATVNRISSSQAVPLLQRALLGNDPLLKSLAVLTLARIASVSALPPMSLQASKLEGKTMVVNPKWVDGVSILYPVLKRARSSPMKKPPSDFEVISQGEFDLVFIHGINGHPITTWRVENEETSAPVPVLSKIRERGKIAVEEGYRAYMSYLSDPEKAAKEIEAEEAICWPRDWLPHYLPRARIMTVSYDIALTRWSSSETVPLKQQAAAILQKLRLFGIGEKPLIFIAHSFGGLIVKEMLLLSSKKEEYRDVVEQTKAILFFSTPHRGSPVADLANGPGDLFFRGSSAVTELYPNNWYLHHLNAFLPKVAPSIRTLSVGEIETCFVSSLSSLGYACYHIVPDESSNPNWKGDHHRFIKLPFNHRQVCKPQSVDDTRFQLVLDFLRENAPSSSASDML